DRTCSTSASWRTAANSTVVSAPTSTNSTTAEPASESSDPHDTRDRRLEDPGQRRAGDGPQRDDEPRGHERDEHPAGHVAAFTVVRADDPGGAVAQSCHVSPRCGRDGGWAAQSWRRSASTAGKAAN